MHACATKYPSRSGSEVLGHYGVIGAIGENRLKIGILTSLTHTILR